MNAIAYMDGAFHRLMVWRARRMSGHTPLRHVRAVGLVSLVAGYLNGRIGRKPVVSGVRAVGLVP